MNKVALVTGAAGFIGSHLCEKLIKENFTVIGIDNFFRGRPENLPESGKNFYFERIFQNSKKKLKFLNKLNSIELKIPW